MSERQAHTARTIANNPDVVEEVIREAKENDDIPTQTAVLRKAAQRDNKELKDRAEEKKPRAMISADVAKYLLHLDEAYDLIAKAPRTITDADFGMVMKK